MTAATETGEALDGRARLVAWACGEIGEQDPNKYYRIAAPQFVGKGAEHSVSWCGIFCLAGLRALEFTDWQWETGKGFVFRLETTRDPQPGDIAVFRKGADGKDIWHHAIVERVDPATKFVHMGISAVHTIDGNVTLSPSEAVKERTRPIDSNVTFYSIGSLLRDYRSKLDTLDDAGSDTSDTEPSGPPSSA